MNLRQSVFTVFMVLWLGYSFATIATHVAYETGIRVP